MSELAPVTNVFDPAYNTVPPGIDRSDRQNPPPERNFGVRPEAPQTGRRTDLSPGNVFDDAYNLVPAPKPGDRRDGPFDSRFNELPRSTDFPAFKGRPRPFNQNGEAGRLYVDEQTGMVVGMEFSEGSKKGQKLVFDRDQQGNITKIHVMLPGQNETPPQYLKFTKTDKGWIAAPNGKSLPGFKYLESKDGMIAGNFKVSAKGDFEYESLDKQTKNILRLNGDRDYFNMRDYSRERESLNGQKATTYWNGYEWLPGQKEQVANGVVKVTFQPQQGKPAYMIRNADTNGFQVEFTQAKVNYKVDNWNEGRMTRVKNGAADTIYSTGVQDNSGKLQWRKGQERVENGRRIVQFNDSQDAEKVRSGELPQGSAIDVTTGDVTSIYADGTQIRSDRSGRQQRITYNNQQYIEVLRDANNDLRGFRRSDNTLVLRAAGEGEREGQESQWIVQRPGREAVRFNGVFKPGNAGAFQITGTNNDGLTVSSQGALSTRIQGQVESDAPQPRSEVGPVPPPARDLAPRRSEVPPQPGDNPIRGRAPLTDAKLQELAQKHKVTPRFIAQARARAESTGLQATFTEENVDKFLTLAAQNNLIADFTDRNITTVSKPGAQIGKLMPELLANPDTALAKLNEQMRESVRAPFARGGATEDQMKRALETVDQRFESIKNSTQPFVSQLKAALARKVP